MPEIDNVLGQEFRLVNISHPQEIVNYVIQYMLLNIPVK